MRLQRRITTAARCRTRYSSRRLVVGAKSGKTYSAATLSAFGEDLNHHSSTSHFNSFFTGKPHVAGLGHAFLMRNYRAGLGKWQTADPLGYPDGWNQLAYCGNKVIRRCDILGCKAGDVYDSLDDAALAWAREYIDDSIKADREYASYFYPCNNGYSYSSPVIGGQHSVDIPRPNDPSQYKGYIHSHGAESEGYADEEFSRPDKSIVNTYGKPGYLVTPSAKLKKMNFNDNPYTLWENVRE